MPSPPEKVKARISVLEDGLKQLKGEQSAFKKSWNSVKIGRKRVMVEKKEPSRAEGRFPLDSIILNRPDEKAEHRARCSLCMAWYEKSSLNYKTSNYKIKELRQSWGYILEGRRYEAAAYLYANTSVCKFCSQFFDQKYVSNNNELSKSSNINDTISSSSSSGGGKKSSSIVKTELKRSNLATIDCDAYQSTTVDGRLANLCLEAPYLKGSKTRREADSWWEIDLGIEQNLHSVSLTLVGGLQQIIEVYVMVIEDRIGFENPFLDSIMGKATAKTNFTLPLRDTRTPENFEWKLPEGFFGRVFRIQIKGYASLVINKFQVWQGDKVDMSRSHMFTDDPMMTIDTLSSELDALGVTVTQEELGLTKSVADLDFSQEETYTPGLFATLSPERIRETLAFSPIRERKTLKDLEKERTGRHDRKTVDDLLNLQTRIAERNKRAFELAYESAIWFTREELLAIREHIFDDITGIKGKPSNTFITEDNGIGRTPPSSKGGRREKEEEVHPYSYNELCGTCLHQSTPRIDLNDLHQKLRQIMLQIDLRQNLKKLGEIGSSERFLFVAEDDEEQLRRLKLSFDFMDNVWDHQDALNVAAAHKRKKRQAKKGMFENEPDIFPVDRGCTWAQCLVILHMMCIKKGRLVPNKAYMITDYRGDDFFDPVSTEYDEVDDKSSIGASSEDFMSLASSQSLSNSMSLPELGPRAKAALGLPPSLLETVRSRTNKPVLNTSFSEFRLGKMTKKVEDYPVFPKKLRADFMKFWVKPKESTKVKDEVVEEVDPILASLEEKVHEPMVPMDALAATTQPFPDRRQDLMKLLERKKKGSYFARICALCEVKFPKNAMGNYVILKHIMRLRREWDPNLIPEKLELLEDGMGMYNLVPVCPFCAQFFDPDFDGGIAFPQRELKVKEDPQITDKLVYPDKKKFLDQRYPLQIAFKEEFVAEPRIIKSRQGAQRMISTTAHLNYQLEQERLRREAMEEAMTENT